MVKITYDPINEVVVKEVIHFEKIEDLVYIFAQLRAAGNPVALSWANGIVFVHSMLSLNTEEVVKDFLRGKVYWANISFAEMPNYKPVYETKQKIQIPIINVNSSSTLREVTEWLKRQK